MKRRTALALLAATAVASAASAAAAASSPSVSTGDTTAIAETHALLHGHVNPNGSATAYWFQWGPTTSYGFTGKVKSAGSGSTSVAVSEEPQGLLPGTVYHYRLVAQNRFGETYGGDRTFKTTGHPLPGAVTGPASSITTSSAIISGAVITNGANTSYLFQWGPAAGDYTAQTAESTARASSSAVGVAAPLTLLPAGTTVHYRLVVIRSGFAPIDGVDAQFTTLPTARPYPSVSETSAPHRAPTRPFTFITSGAVASSAFPAEAECNGDVEVRYFFGLRLVFDKLVAVQPNCAFAIEAGFLHKFKFHGHSSPSERLRVTVHFLGNHYLAPARAPVKHVFIGS